jgi:Ankyrin repeat.
MAAKNGHQEVVRHLYENGADITVDDNYSLKMAEKNGQLDVVKRLGENIE